jgi:hypothetical protein
MKISNLLLFFKTIEKLTQSIHELIAMVFRFIRQCDEIQFPNDVESTKKIFNQTTIYKNELEQELRRIKM